MNEYLESLTLDDLAGEQYDLAECLGLEAYKKLVYNYGGSSIYICKSDTLLKSDNYIKIKQKFNGYNYRELAKEYDLSERTVRRIVEDEVEKVRASPLENQLSFDSLP